MDNDDTGICGRNKEIKGIKGYISSRIQDKQSGILYLTGPPGTGKSMSIQYVLDQIKDVPKFNLNCLRAQSSKHILMKLCQFAGLDKFIKCNESELLSRLAKRLTSRTTGSHIIVLDEMDQLPKSKNVDLIKTIFSWPSQAQSKLILIGIANTVNLTARYQTINLLLGEDESTNVTKIIFKPYSSKDIKEILLWYLENDENFEDASYEPKALEMIAKKFARENGDIRGALNALKSAIDDTLQKEISKHPISLETEGFPTPPATPPLSPCKEKTNLASVANSVRKRQKVCTDDRYTHQIILTCLVKLTSNSGQDSAVDERTCRSVVTKVLEKAGVSATGDEYRAMLDNLELHGLIGFKKGRLNRKIIIRDENEVERSIQDRRDMIMNLINKVS